MHLNDTCCTLAPDNTLVSPNLYLRNMNLNNFARIKTNAATKTEHAHGLRDLFTEELRTAYFSEILQASNLPKLISYTSNLELRETLYAHIEETKSQIRRFETIFSVLGAQFCDSDCQLIVNLVDDSLISQMQNIFTRDSAIVSAVQKVEHYEIASYGTLLSFARTLAEHEAAAFLQDSLMEEKDLDRRLTELSVMININALSVDYEFGA